MEGQCQDSLHPASILQRLVNAGLLAYFRGVNTRIIIPGGQPPSRRTTYYNGGGSCYIVWNRLCVRASSETPVQQVRNQSMSLFTSRTMEDILCSAPATDHKHLSRGSETYSRSGPISLHQTIVKRAGDDSVHPRWKSPCWFFAILSYPDLCSYKMQPCARCTGGSVDDLRMIDFKTGLFQVHFEPEYIRLPSSSCAVFKSESIDWYPTLIIRLN